MWIVASAVAPVDPPVAPMDDEVDDGVDDALGEGLMLMPGSMDAPAGPATVEGAAGEPVPAPQALAPMIVAAPIRARARRWRVVVVFMAFSSSRSGRRPRSRVSPCHRAAGRV
ncbi:hypothetical protein GCM10027449_21160 [Sinomonas notoginsengisoli]